MTTTVCGASRSGNTPRNRGASRRRSWAKPRRSSAEPGGGTSGAPGSPAAEPAQPVTRLVILVAPLDLEADLLVHAPPGGGLAEPLPRPRAPLPRGQLPGPVRARSEHPDDPPVLDGKVGHG